MNHLLIRGDSKYGCVSPSCSFVSVELLNDLQVLWRQWTVTDGKDVPMNLRACHTFEELKVHYFQLICNAGAFAVVGGETPIDPTVDEGWPIPSGTEINLNTIQGLGLYRHPGFDSPGEVLEKTDISRKDLSDALGGNFQNEELAQENFVQFCSLTPTDPIPGVRREERQTNGRTEQVWVLTCGVHASASGLPDLNNDGVEIVVPFETSGDPKNDRMYK